MSGRRTARRGGRDGADAGISLVELVLAVFMLGTATVTILGAFGTLIKTSDLASKTSDAGTGVAALAGAIADNGRTPFVATCDPNAYDAAADAFENALVVADPAGAWDVSIVSVQWWDGRLNGNAGGFTDVCPLDGGGQPLIVPSWRLQRIEVRVRSGDGKADRTVSVVKRG